MHIKGFLKESLMMWRTQSPGTHELDWKMQQESSLYNEATSSLVIIYPSVDPEKTGPEEIELEIHCKKDGNYMSLN